MDIQATAVTPAAQTGPVGAGTGKASGSGGKGDSDFAVILGGQQNGGAATDASSANTAPDAQTISLLGLLQMLQSMLPQLQNQLTTNDSTAQQQGVQALPALLLKAMNGNPGFAQQLLQNPNMQNWLKQAATVLQALAQPNGASVMMNVRNGLTDQQKLTAQDTLLQLATLAGQQPGNPILQHLLNELQRAVEPFLASQTGDASTDGLLGIAGAQTTTTETANDAVISALQQTSGREKTMPKHLLNSLQSGDNVIVQQVVVDTNGDGQLQQTKSKLEMLAAKTSGITAALQQAEGSNAADADGSQSSTSDSSPFPTPALPLQDLLKTLQQTNFDAKLSAQATIHAQTFVSDMSDFMVKNMKFTLGDTMKEARLLLNPEHLGQIDVKITLHTNGQLIAQLTADSAAGRQLLESQLPQLRQTLQSQGLQVERLEVAQQADMASNMFQQQRQGQGGGQQFGKNNRTRLPEAEAVDGEFVNDLRTLADFRQNVSNGSASDPLFDVTA